MSLSINKGNMRTMLPNIMYLKICFMTLYVVEVGVVIVVAVHIC